MKACVSSWGYRKWFDEGKCDLLGFLDEVRRLRADGCEIFPAHLDGQRYAEHLKQVARKAGAMKLEVSSLIVGNDFARAQIAARAEEVEKMTRAIAAAAGAGIRRLNVFTGHHAEGADPEMETARVIDCFREVCPLAEKKRVLLCVENHSSVHRDVDGLLWIIRAIGSRAMRTNPDPTNFCAGFSERTERERQVIYASTQRYVQNAANAHLKIRDFTRAGEHACCDVPRLAKIFKGAGYNGPVVLEYYGPGDPARPNELGMKLLRKYFK